MSHCDVLKTLNSAMNSRLSLLYRCHHHQKPFTCFQRFSCSRLRWVISRSLKWMQHCTVTYQIQTHCQLFHCQGRPIQQYRIFNFIEDGLFSAPFFIAVLMIMWSVRNAQVISSIVLFLTFRTFDAIQNSADTHKELRNFTPRVRF